MLGKKILVPTVLPLTSSSVALAHHRTAETGALCFAIGLKVNFIWCRLFAQCITVVP